MVATLVEWRARRIADPVERLRFLRRVTARPLAAEVKRFKRRARLAVLVVIALLIPLGSVSMAGRLLRAERSLSLKSVRPSPERMPNVWLVESGRDHETYSNGLRVEKRFQTANERRAYPVFDQERPDQPPVWRTDPVGIVYHTTESQLAPFDAGQNRTLRRLGGSLLEFVRRNRSYHFVIDRFGRVHRIVAESDAANHAGASVWEEDGRLYVGLNQSFLGISFESQTRGENDAPAVNPAQVHAARVLTEMLRARFGIAARNCITHAQVSVNPRNMRIGYHTDWAGNFPFVEIGLSENYSRPLPSLYAFGFTYDPAFVNSTGARLWQGLALAEEELRQRASAGETSVQEYRAALRHRYREILAALKTTGAEEEIQP